MSCKTKGEIIREYRMAARLTQTKLGELCEVDSSLISAVELGNRNPTLSLLKKISSVLEIDNDCLGLCCDDDSELGTILKHYRKKENISLQTVSVATGVSVKILTQMEKNERLIPEKHLKEIVKVLNIQDDESIMNMINDAYEKSKSKFLLMYEGDIIKLKCVLLELSNLYVAESLGISDKKLYSIRRGKNKKLLEKLSPQIAELLDLDIKKLSIYLN